MAPALVALSLGALACSPSAGRAAALYSEGRYIEAAEVFERTEARLAQSPPDDQAAYGLYRGLTMLRLGDHRRAREWLGYAFRVAHAHPGSLDPKQQKLLRSGWEQLEARPDGPPRSRGAEIAQFAEPASGPGPGNGHRSVTATP